MTGQAVLANALQASSELLTRFLVGFDDNNRTRQAEHLPNHVSWSLGHLALYLNHVAQEIDERGLPEDNFLAGDGSGGTATRYDTKSICFGSVPIDDASKYPTLERGRQIYEAACERLANAVRRAEDCTLTRKVNWHGTEIMLSDWVSRVTFHNGIHTGQIMDLRRALGLAPVLQ